MDSLASSSEVIESLEELNIEANINEITQKNHAGNHNLKFSLEDDINKLFEAIDIKNSRQSEKCFKDALRKSAMKRPVRPGSSPVSAIGISEPLNLKQALRGLCISQASEMAATKKRLSKQSRLSGVSEAGAMKRLHGAVIREATEFGPPNDAKRNLVEISLVPECSTSNFVRKMSASRCVSDIEQSNANAQSSTLLAHSSTGESKMMDTQSEAEIIHLPTNPGPGLPKGDTEYIKRLKRLHSSFGVQTNEKVPVLDEIVPAAVECSITSVFPEKEKGNGLFSASFSPISSASCKVSEPTNSGACLMRPVFRSKTFVKKKVMANLASFSGSSNQCTGGAEMKFPRGASEAACPVSHSALGNGKREEKVLPASCRAKDSLEGRSTLPHATDSKQGFPLNSCNKSRSIVAKSDERSRSKEKGEISQSSKSSIGDYSSTTSFSEDSYISGCSRSGHRPHMSNDLRWAAIHCVQKQHGTLCLRHFKLLKKLGGGDIGTVYLSELIGTSCLFAVKVMDTEFLASRRKLLRAQNEKEILQMLDHPFLPTLYATFTTDKFSCLVMEYCPGGDLHVLRQKQPHKSFSEQAVRFYVAEVLLALEYLHMLGVIYRDLKPENVLVREDGHIMLSDFDLCLRCTVKPTVLKSSSLPIEPQKEISSNTCSESSCIDPFCLHPSWQVSCFTPRFLSAAAKSRKIKSDLAAQVSPMPQLVVEPTSARSNSFVGTHEYLAPEIIKGEGHGSAVDWWTFGIFLFELLYSRTPFKGQGNEDTLANVVSQCLKFPGTPSVSSHARDLIRRLLQKEPENRLGFVKGAAEIKQHAFFEGLNWALVRCATPPELPRFCDFGNLVPGTMSQHKGSGKNPKEFDNTGENIEFEMF